MPSIAWAKQYEDHAHSISDRAHLTGQEVKKESQIQVQYSLFIDDIQKLARWPVII